MDENSAPAIDASAAAAALASANAAALDGCEELRAQAQVDNRSPVQADQITADGFNAEPIWCRHCKTIIIEKNVGVFREKEIFMHYPTRAEAQAKNESGETLMQHWLLTSQMHFENVAVTNRVASDLTRVSNDDIMPDGSAPPVPESSLVGQGQFRYLICATCDRGPFGISYGPREWYLTHTRLRYAPNKSSLTD